MIKQLLKFVLVGLSNMTIDFGFYWILTRSLGVQDIYANYFALALAMLNSFTFNRRLTFRLSGKGRLAEQSAKFLILNIGLYLTNNFCFYLLVRNLMVFDIYAKLGVGLSLALINFLILKFWVFPHSDKALENVII